MQDTGLLASKPVTTPLDYNHTLIADHGEILSDPASYLTVTRSDITYAVNLLSQFMSSPCDTHWQAALRVVRYIKYVPDHGILLSSNSSLRLHAYCDADWASYPTSRRSTTSYCIFLGPSLLCWRTKKQSIVSRSSAEAEYRAMENAVSELTWLHTLLHELGIPPHPPTLSCDNEASLHIANNPVFHERTKHVEIDCHFV